MPTPTLQLRIRGLVFHAFLFTVLPIAVAAQPASAIQGSWRLERFTSRDETGAIAYPMGTTVQGYLVYDTYGNVSAHIMRADRPRFAGNDRARGSDEETRAAFVGYLAYFGEYSVDSARRTIMHKIRGATFPNWIGEEQRREFELAGDQLTIRTPPLLAGGAKLTTELVWRRVR